MAGHLSRHCGPDPVRIAVVRSPHDEPSTRTEQLLEQLTWHWERPRAAPMLDGLTDDEYFWEPVAGLLEHPAARRGRTRRWRREAATSSPTSSSPSPIPHRSPPSPGGSPTCRRRLRPAQRVALRWPAGRLPDATCSRPRPRQALAELDDAYGRWVKGVAGLPPTTSSRPVGPAEGRLRRVPVRRPRAPHQPRGDPPRRRDPAAARPLPGHGRRAVSALSDSDRAATANR